jgi:cysteine desulfurase
LNKCVYLDNNATTPLDPRVLDAMMPYLTEKFGNAASRTHRYGGEAKEAVENARAEVATLIGARPSEIVWTSGATESVNLAISGVMKASRGKANGILTCVTEHRAVLDVCKHLEKQGFEASYLSVDRQGRIDLDELRAAITDRTALVSIMHANNETGTLHPIGRIGAICKERSVLFHTDATQSVGKEPIDVEADGIDLLSFSAHKLHGPKGVGGLYVRSRGPRVRCDPLIHGGGHERGMRSGTLNVAGIVGCGDAARLCGESMDAERRRLGRLRDRLFEIIRMEVGDVIQNGDPENRLDNTLSVSFPGVEAERLMAETSGVAVSSSAACTSATSGTSHVLEALGLSESAIFGAIRFSLGRFTTSEEIEYAGSEISAGVARLRGQASEPISEYSGNQEE